MDGHFGYGITEGFEPQDSDDCPNHGSQMVIREYASAGSDPYAINVLTCGCHVTCFGPGEANVMVRPAPRPAPRKRRKNAVSY